jgi:hypothetical protein
VIAVETGISPRELEETSPEVMEAMVDHMSRQAEEAKREQMMARLRRS